MITNLELQNMNILELTQLKERIDKLLNKTQTEIDQKRESKITVAPVIKENE